MTVCFSREGFITELADIKVQRAKCEMEMKKYENSLTEIGFRLFYAWISFNKANLAKLAGELLSLLREHV